MLSLPNGTDDAISQAASTNIAHLATRPVFVLVTSAFIDPGNVWLWVPLTLIIIGGLERRIGTKRTLGIAFGAHVIASLLSEGLLLIEIFQHTAPASDVHILDVGPSYVMLAAVVGCLMVGRKWLRVAAFLAGAILIPGMLVGLDGLDVSAVGHLMALFFGGVITLGYVLADRRRLPAAKRTPITRPIFALPAAYACHLWARYRLPAGTPLPESPLAGKRAAIHWPRLRQGHGKPSTSRVR